MADIFEILQYVIKHNGSSFFFTPLKNGDEVSYFFKLPAVSIECHQKNNVENTLSEIDKLSKYYPFAYGYITYEVGYTFEERLENLLDKSSQSKLMLFHFYNSSSVEKIETKNIDFSKIKTILTDNKSFVNNFQLTVDFDTYKNNIQKIKKLIAKGDTYQVNYTLKSHFNFDGHIPELFLQLLFNQSASYTAIINDNDKFIISISPELFFQTDGTIITSKPMKGTIQRGLNIIEDKVQKKIFTKSKKDRAENIMIVDLLRNDLGKICEIDSVFTEHVYDIEKYETVYQMTSTVKGKLKEKSFKNIIRNLFPCGSITGAPKIRTMGIIKELEKANRGVYTGTIGIIEKNNFTFNIPIRTIKINKVNNKGELGIGGGIVWDSDPQHEFNEAQLKGKFLTEPEKYFELIETMLVENGEIFLWNYHIKRLSKAADYFLFYFEEKNIISKIIESIKYLDLNKKYRLKLLLSKWGEIRIDISELLLKQVSVKAVISTKQIDSRNKFQFFKTTNRMFYNNEYNLYKNKFTDVIFINEKGNLTEGAITNVMIRKNNYFYTPPIEDGILNGCYREYLLNNRNDIEIKSFGIDELLSADELILMNSVKKEIKISELFKDGKLIKKYY